MTGYADAQNVTEGGTELQELAKIESDQEAALPVPKLPPSSSSDEGESQEVGASGAFRRAIDKFVWRGGSAADAYLNAASAQVGQVILTIPTSAAQMGLTSLLIIQVTVAVMGMWTAFLLCALYNEYLERRKNGPEEKRLRKGHIVQYHEVMEEYLGRWGKYATLTFNILALGGLGVVQIIACSSDIYLLSSSLNKRDWALIWGGATFLTCLIPTLHNYRVWSFLGLLATTYTTWFMVGSSINHGQVKHVHHQISPVSLQDFFLGLTNLLFAFGGHSITVEVMHAMWKPKKFAWVYPLSVLYVFTLTIPNSTTMYWAYGSNLLKNSNALATLDPGPARSTAIVLMIIHQCVAFGLFVTPLYFMFEKLIGTHHSPLWIRLPSRIPVTAILYLIAVAFPFFGPINSIMGAFFTTFATYIIPCVAYTVAYRKIAARNAAVMKPPPFLGRSWNLAFAINALIIVFVGVAGVGFGGWASILAFIQQIHTYKVFAACYQCPKPVAKAVKALL